MFQVAKDEFGGSALAVVHGKDIETLVAAALHNDLEEELAKTFVGVYNAQIFLEKELETDKIALKNLRKREDIQEMFKEGAAIASDEHAAHHATQDSIDLKTILHSPRFAEGWRKFIKEPYNLSKSKIGFETISDAIERLYQQGGLGNKPPQSKLVKEEKRNEIMDLFY